MLTKCDTLAIIIKRCEPLAQPAEHLTFNQGVRSSNLRWLTMTPNVKAFGVFLLQICRHCKIHPGTDLRCNRFRGCLFNRGRRFFLLQAGVLAVGRFPVPMH